MSLSCALGNVLVPCCSLELWCRWPQCIPSLGPCLTGLVPCAQVGLAELQRVCKGQHADIFSLQEALAAAQPASAQINWQRLARPLASSVIMQGAALQQADQNLSGTAAALARSKPQLLQFPVPQALWIHQMPPPAAAATVQPRQEQSAIASLALSAGPALTDHLEGMAGSETSGHAEMGPTPAPAGLPEHPTAEACTVSPAADADHSPRPLQLPAVQQAPLTDELPLPGEVAATMQPPPEEPATPPEAAPLTVSNMMAAADGAAGNEATGRAMTAPTSAPESLPGMPATKSCEADPDMEELSVPATEIELCPVPAAATQKAWGKSKSCPLLVGPLASPKPHAAVQGRRRSRKQMRRTISECSSKAAEAMQGSWTQGQGPGSMLSQPASAAEAAGAGQVPAERSAAEDVEAARSECNQVRQPSAEALLAVPHHPASSAKQKVSTSPHYKSHLLCLNPAMMYCGVWLMSNAH